MNIKQTESTDWTKEDDDLLFQIVAMSPNSSWVERANWFGTKLPEELESRWCDVIEPQFPVKREWTDEEDIRLRELVSTYGKDWGLIGASIKDRSIADIKQRCKLLSSIETKPFSKEEDRLIEKKNTELNGNWEAIAQFFDGRRPYEIKERFKDIMKEKADLQKALESVPQPPDWDFQEGSEFFDDHFGNIGDINDWQGIW